MATTPDIHAGLSLRLERTYQAPPERVFDAWIQPDQVARWFAPSTEYEAVVTALDVRAGGRYRVEMRHRGGDVHVVTGVYHEVSRPTKLVMSWAWEGGVDVCDTRVTVELTPLESGTRLVLRHEQFPSEMARGEHEKGWTGCLERLGPLLTGPR
jgi:uncharacterized protein YndB with AHSA1/START domain